MKDLKFSKKIYKFHSVGSFKDDSIEKQNSTSFILALKFEPYVVNFI
jgi:hypothetical protein